MRSSTSTSSTPVLEHSAPARRNRRMAERRARRRPILFATGLGLAVATIVGCAGAMPLSSAEASGGSAAAMPYMMLASYSTPAPLAADAEPALADETAAAEARAAVDAADAAVASAAEVTADIQASGLDIGVATTTVDTTQLEETADRLELSIDSLPESLLPSVTEDVTALVSTVQEQVSGLRGHLDAAVQAKKEAEEKARREAEEKARQAAEAEAAAAERARQQQSSGSGGGGWVPPVPVGGASGDNSPAGAQATARGMLGSYGWGDDQFGCLYNLWQRESGWNYQAYNASSGAFGIPQALPGSKMASAGADWQTSARTQIAWGLGYISGRYGTPCNAWGHSQSVGWY